MKKLVSFVLLFVIALSFSACNPDKEVDYYEKQEVQGSYTIDDFTNLHESLLPYDMHNSFVEFSFTVSEMGYSPSTYYRYFKLSTTVFGSVYLGGGEYADNEAVEFVFFINTTIPFYEDSTQIGERLVARGFLTINNSGFSLSPAFIIT